MVPPALGAWSGNTDGSMSWAQDMVGEDGRPWDMVGGDGRPWDMVGGDGRPWDMVGGDGRPWDTVGDDGTPWGSVSKPVSPGDSSRALKLCIRSTQPRNSERQQSEYEHIEFQPSPSVLQTPSADIDPPSSDLPPERLPEVLQKLVNATPVDDIYEARLAAILQ